MAAYDGLDDDNAIGFVNVPDPYAFLTDPSYAPAPLSPRWFAGTSGQLDADQEARAWGELAADPLFQRIASTPAPYDSVPLEWAALEQYAFNDPRSPLYGLNVRPQGRYVGTYRVVVDNGGAPTGLTYEGLGPQHWYTDPGVIGPIVVGTAIGAELFPGLYGGGGGGAGGGGSAATEAAILTGTPAAGAAAAGAGVAGTIAAISGGAATAITAARTIANALGHDPNAAAAIAAGRVQGAPGGFQLNPELVFLFAAAAAVLLLRK